MGAEGAVQIELLTVRFFLTVKISWLYLSALLALPVGYWVARQCLPDPEVRVGESDQLVWLEREFDLSPEALLAIRRLQEDYAPVCAGHCAAIAAVELRLREAAPEERPAAEAELERLHEVCAAATRAHLQAIAAFMSPAEGRRFLRLMEPRVAHQPGQTTAPALHPAP